jgi:hypothetical protein
MSMDASPGRHSDRPKTGGKDGKSSHLRLVYSRDWQTAPPAKPEPDAVHDERNWTFVLVVIAAVCCGALGVILWAT